MNIKNLKNRQVDYWAVLTRGRPTAHSVGREPLPQQYHGYNVNSHDEKYPKYLGIDTTYLFEFGTDDYEFTSYEDALEAGLQEGLKTIQA